MVKVKKNKFVLKGKKTVTFVLYFINYVVKYHVRLYINVLRTCTGTNLGDNKIHVY